VTNVWVPDGYKDVTFDRKAPRERLARSLDEIFAAPIDPAHNLDSVEPKLFGIGSETCVVGSFEFYLGYAITRKKLLCLDMGHFHPTENVADKVTSVMLYVERVLFHVSRGIRWDSDHVVILNDELRGVAEELVRGDYLGRVHVGLDYFDASIQRVAAWVVGIRAMLKALLAALLEPAAKLRALEQDGDFTSRLALFEEVKTLPLGAVWEYYCMAQGVPVGMAWMDRVKDYERRVTSQRR
jgi:L-rhamnose isomerase